MFIPLRTNREPKRRPLVTEGLIILNLLVYLAGLVMSRVGAGDGLERLAGVGHLARHDFHAWNLITYQFLHDPHSILHLAFNMLFLWIFGAAVEDRLGRLSFLAFYLLGGVVAGVGHMIVAPEAPVIGASGSIAAVTGAFLALFPRSRIKVFVIFFFIGVFEIPALWFIGLFFAIDVVSQVSDLLGGGDSDVAFMAHIAGSVYGFTLAFVLLALQIVKREEFDIFYLLRQSRRRSAFRRATRGRVGGAWESASADTARQLAKRSSKPAHAALTDADREAAAARSVIRAALAQHDTTGAARLYRDLLERAPASVLMENEQLDIANQLHADGDYDTAARAYELLLSTYPSCPAAAQVRLILGLIYVRRLGRPERATELITKAKAALRDPAQQALADELLGEISP